MSVPYNPRLRLLARELRNRSTLAEVLLWKHLKHGKRLGYDFHRQKPILEWIADFYCAELKLVIEIDGDSHRVKAKSDIAKESAFRSLGLTVLRFGDTQVKQNAEGVAELVDRWIESCRTGVSYLDEHTPPFGHPSQAQEGMQSK
jgi:very-short-patch-repair endonuclease